MNEVIYSKLEFLGFLNYWGCLSMVLRTDSEYLFLVNTLGAASVFRD